MYNYYPNYDLRNNKGIDGNNLYSQNYYPEAQDDRFFLGPFLVGGLAGTALGYGIANNNQIGNMPYPQPMYFVPAPQQFNQPCPYMYSSNNNYYY